MSVRIGATNDGCDRDNRSIIVETVFRYKTVKAAAFTHMRKLDSRYVVGDSPCLCGDTTNLIWWHEKKLGLLVDESCNEPRAGNSVNHWTFSSNPFHHMSPQAEALMPPRLLLTVLPRHQNVNCSKSPTHNAALRSPGFNLRNSVRAFLMSCSEPVPRLGSHSEINRRAWPPRCPLWVISRHFSRNLPHRIALG